jgi:hypothetical protein
MNLDPPFSSTSAWTFSLRTDRSEWGCVSEFFESIYSTATVENDCVLWDMHLSGTTQDSSCRIASDGSQGLAIYHGDRAHLRKGEKLEHPQITLIGDVIAVNQEGRRVTSLRIRVPGLAFCLFEQGPLVSRGPNKRLFDNLLPDSRQIAFKEIDRESWQAILAWVGQTYADNWTAYNTRWWRVASALRNEP